MDPTFLYKTGGSMNYLGFSDEGLDAEYEKLKNGEYDGKFGRAYR